MCTDFLVNNYIQYIIYVINIFSTIWLMLGEYLSLLVRSPPLAKWRIFFIIISVIELSRYLIFKANAKYWAKFIFDNYNSMSPMTISFSCIIFPTIQLSCHKWEKAAWSFKWNWKKDSVDCLLFSEGVLSGLEVSESCVAH